MSWALDPRIEAASAFVADLPLCQARLQDDARWPWIVLVPRRAGLVEIEQLTERERGWLIEEAVAAGAVVRRLGAAAGRRVEKLNVGALGNVVAQLHLHVVGRRRDDPAWPGPVWGYGETSERLPAEVAGMVELAAAMLSETAGLGER